MNDRPVIGIREPGSLALVQSLLRHGVAVRIRVTGNSMQPLLKGGEIVEVEPLLKKKPQLGDILLLCDRQGNPFVHRLIWQRMRNGTLHLLTKGDACVGFDGFSPAENVLGRVRRIIPETGPPISLNKPLQRLLASLIVSRTLILHALRKWKRIPLQFVKKNMYNKLEE
jgi:hypothetical protein